MKKYIDILRGNPLFVGLNENEIESVLAHVDARVFSKYAGEYIFRAGDTTSSMGIVLSGAVTVLQEDLWGYRNIMARILSGGVFAETFAAAPGAVMNVGVLADEDCELMMLDVNRLLNAPQASGGCQGRVIRNLVAVLAQKTMAFNDKITHISKRSTREKLLSFLSSEAIRQGKSSFYMSYNRQQLADYLCVERAAMCVELSRLQKEGLIRYKKSYFELREWDKKEGNFKFRSKD